jgi:hypothetical protein
MGARTNFIVKQGDNRFVTLYSHWGGDTKLTDLARALEAARPRWSDYGYATRILFNALQDEHSSETGYGIYADEFGGEESFESTIIDFTNLTVIVDDIPHSFDSFINFQLEVVS